MIVKITNENYESEVISSETPVVLDFGAPWCVPCKKLFQTLEDMETAGELEGIKIGKVDIEESPDIAIKNGIISIPAIVFFKGGKVAGKLAGVKPKKAILKLVGK